MSGDYSKEITLSLDTGAYAANDVLAQTQTITGAYISGGYNILYSIALLDKSDQGGALDLVFFRSNTPLGAAAENATLNIADAGCAEILTIVPFTAGDYEDLLVAQLAMKGPADSGMGALLHNADNTDSDMYMGAISRDTKTYGAAGIVVKIGLLRSK